MVMQGIVWIVRIVVLAGHGQRPRQLPDRTLKLINMWLSVIFALLVSSLYYPFHSNSHVLLGGTASQSHATNITNASRVLLLTAHPDDECLFFAPTVLALQEDPSHPEIYSLTMSVGNADGLGETRKEELSRSLDVLRIDQDKRWVVDHP